jgi:hypothetical protein
MPAGVKQGPIDELRACFIFRATRRWRGSALQVGGELVISPAIKANLEKLRQGQDIN